MNRKQRFIVTMLATTTILVTCSFDGRWKERRVLRMNKTILTLDIKVLSFYPNVVNLYKLRIADIRPILNLLVVSKNFI